MDPLFTLFDIDVSVYAVIIACAALVSGALFGLCAPRFKKGTKALVCALTVVFGFLFARLTYIMVYLGSFIDGVIEEPFFSPYTTGYGLIGVLLGGVLACALTAKLRKERFSLLADGMAPWAALALAVCRFGEYFTEMGRGRFVDDVTEAYLCHFPIAVSNQWDEWHFAVFFTEGLTALIIFLFLLIRSRRANRAGTQYKLFFLLFFSTQVLWENMRFDEFLRWSYFIRVTQLVAALVPFLMMLWTAFRVSGRVAKWKAESSVSFRSVVICLIAYLIAVGVCIAIEFALDKLGSFPNWALYLIMMAMCAVLGVTSYHVLIRAENAPKS